LLALTRELRLTDLNPGVKMRLVRIGPKVAVWEVVAIVARSGHSLWEELRDDQGHGGIIQMRATLKTDVPLNGPPRNPRKSRDLGGGIYEFKGNGIRVLWFHDKGKRIVCTHSTPKMKKKKFQSEIEFARRAYAAYLDAKRLGTLGEPEEPEKKK
jgi:Phage derived protein Gp49-like (DUF891)